MARRISARRRGRGHCSRVARKLVRGDRADRPPTLTTAPYAPPATFTWTPAPNGPNILDPNTSAAGRRGDGVCPPGPVTGGGTVGPVRDMAAGSHTTSATIPDGVYCFHIRTTSLLTLPLTARA